MPRARLCSSPAAAINYHIIIIKTRQQRMNKIYCSFSRPLFGGRVVHVERDWFSPTPQSVSHGIHIGCKSAYVSFSIGGCVINERGNDATEHKGASK